MTEQEFNQLRFREVTHTTFDDRYSTIYECVSEPLADRLKVCTWVKRNKQTGMTLGKQPLVHYSLDGKLYRKKEELLEAINKFDRMDKCRCVGCVYLDDPYSFAVYRCKLNKGVIRGNYKVTKCMFDRTNITKEKAVKVLHDFQKYRRGAKEFEHCPHPYLIGIAIDKAINSLRML